MRGGRDPILLIPPHATARPELLLFTNSLYVMYQRHRHRSFLAPSIGSSPFLHPVMTLILA